MDPDDVSERISENIEWIEPRAQQLSSAETARSQALDAKANQVLAVAAVATSIVATSFPARLAEASSYARVLGALAGLSVLISAVAALSALIPRSYASFATAEIEQWPTGAFLSAQPNEMRGPVLNGWVTLISRARRVNAEKTRALRMALASLALALLLTIATAGTLSS